MNDVIPNVNLAMMAGSGGTHSNATLQCVRVSV
jgi:hypothetical protein